MHNSLEKILRNGLSITYKNDLSIDPINHRGVPNRNGYQVICNRKGFEFGELYRENELEAAVDKFILLQKCIIGKE